MKQTIKDIQKISLLFFIVTGILHIGSNLLIANNLFINKATLIFKIIDIPFILTGTIYSLSSIRLMLTKKNSEHKNLDIALASLTIVILITLLVINMLIPNLVK